MKTAAVLFRSPRVFAPTVRANLTREIQIITQKFTPLSTRYGQTLVLTEMLCHSAFLGLGAEHFEADTRNLAGMFLHISVVVLMQS